MATSFSSDSRSESKPLASPSEYRNYACGIRAPVRTSHTSENPERRFLGCFNYRKDRRCSYFVWYDPPMCARGREFGNHVVGKLKAAKNENAELKQMNEEILKKVGEIISSTQRLAERVDELCMKNEELSKKNEKL